MNKYRSRLLFVLIAFIIGVLVCLGLVLGQLFQKVYYNNFNENTTQEIELTAHFIETMSILSGESSETELESILGTLELQLTLLSEDQAVIYTNYTESGDAFDTAKMEGMLQKARRTPGEVQKLEWEEDSYYYVVYMYDSQGNEGYLVVNTSFQLLSNVTKQIWLILIVGLGLALLVITLVVLKIIEKYIKPIESITDVSIELANGNYSARAYETSIDEMGVLSEAINVLARNLQVMKANDEMQQDRLSTLIENVGSAIILIDGKGHITLANKVYKEWFEYNQAELVHQLYYEAIPYRKVIKLVEEVLLSEGTVRKQFVLSTKVEKRELDVYGAPIIGNDHEWKGILVVFHDIHELKKLEQVRKDFVANVSHELRTPITSIKGFSETLLDGAMEDEQLRKYFLGIILKESERMQLLIEDLLDLSKIEQVGFELNAEKVHLSGLLEEIYVLLQKKAEKKQITFSLEAEKNVYMLGDVDRLKQVFLNIVNNAILYTPEHGEIILSLKDEGKNVSVKVQDTGIGIAKEEISRIFERFYRVDKARSRESGGTGLGLAIVKHLVEAHHGNVEVESEVGEGTEFTIILPKS